MNHEELNHSSIQEEEALKQLIESQIVEILAGFKETLIKHNLSDYYVIKFSLAKEEDRDSKERIPRVVVPCPPYPACLE